MAPLSLDGDTLGQKHQHFNKLVKQIIADEKAELLPLNYDDPDVDNLLRIDVACGRRNVDYILNVLQSEDMLYVSRAIKQSTWLITDDQYAHIINPKYLHNELFPKMTKKAQNKLILAIRLNLKNQSRAEEFYNYYSNDIKVAQKWLTLCSFNVVEKVYTDNIHEITAETFKRQCETSIEALKILLKVRDWSYVGDKLSASKMLLNKYPEEYLDILLTLHNYEIPAFGIHATQQIMKKCPEKLINNFHKFRSCVHLATFAKCLKKHDIKEFLLKQAEIKDMKDWIKYDNLKHFVKYLPKENRFEFAKKLFIDKEEISPPDPIMGKGLAAPMMSRCVQFRSSCEIGSSSNAHIYRWYQFAPFDTALTDLKKLIRVESSPAERNAMLVVLINCARRNSRHVQTLLQFYREKHMNEPFKFKVQFVNTLLTLVATHKFDSNTWAILNDIFSSMEVYIESDNSVPFCVKAVIVYKLLHNEEIPEIIQKKHTFDTFKDYRKKLEEKEQKILFTYLYDLEMTKLNKQTTNNEVEMDKAFDLLNNVLTLLKEWEKSISDFPLVLEKIKHIIKIKKENSFKNSLSSIYDMQKKWRRYMFEESLELAPNDKACVNALRHDPELLLRYNTNVAAMCSNDTVSLKQTLNKIRIYWAQTMAQKWTEAYFEALDKPTGHKATTEGICILVPRDRFLNLLKKYAPVETKIDWSNTDATLLSLQKNIAKRLKLVRPSISLDAVLTYAKEDYLQFAMPSLNALMHNMSALKVSESIPLLFDAPVSLKKHGLRLAYTKLKFSEIKDLVENMWKTTKNSSIKTVLFKETFELLKKEKKDSSIKDLWELLKMFINNLTTDESRIIYNTLGKAASLPLAVRPEFFMKGYTYLKGLPAKANCDSVLQALDRQAQEIIGLLDASFVEEVLLLPTSQLVDMITEKNDNYQPSELNVKAQILTSYVLNSETEEMQHAKYEKHLSPVLTDCFKSFDLIKGSSYVVKDNCLMLLKTFLNNIKSMILKNSTIHVNFFKEIEKRLRVELPFEENYRFITFWSLTVLFVESLNNNKNSITISGDHALLSNTSNNRDKSNKLKDENWEEICKVVAPQFGKACLMYIKEDIVSKYNSLVTVFVRSLSDVFDNAELQNISRLYTLKHMLEVDVPVSYIIVLESANSLYIHSDENQIKQRRELFGIIRSHSSTDVKIHYAETTYGNPEIAVPYEGDGILR